MQLQGDYWVLCESGTKRPLDWRTGAVGNAQSPELWLSRELAESWALVWGARLGYVLAPECGYWCLDVDKRELADELSLELLGALSGCAVELSQSGTGFHVWGRGSVGEHACKHVGERLELYSGGRYIALGQYLMGDCDWDATEQLPAVVDRWFAPRVAVAAVPASTQKRTADDTRVLERALAQKPSAAMVLGGKLTFAQLWAGELPEGHDASSADAALAQHLAYWCGRDAEQMSRLMWRSGLVRPKWDRADYIPRTVAKACELCERVWEPPAATAVGDFLNGEDQAALFAGCVLVPADVAAFTPAGIMGRETFNLHFNRRKFIMDGMNDKVADEAWKAFTQSQVYSAPKADGYCFKPHLGPGELVRDSGLTFVNTYRRLEVPSVHGDVGPMLEHLEWMYPNAGDRAQMLAYAAAVVQYPGIKFHWAPVFQGAQGNGKGMLAECVLMATPLPYRRKPAIDDIANKFNSWAEGALFAFGDELQIQPHMMDRLKLLITSRTIEIEAKGKDKRTTEICVNFMFATNYRTAVPDAKSERRFAIYYSAQQDKEELEADGTSKRAARAWDWLIDEGGYARVTHYLQNYSIPDELNPTVGCRTAPRTSSYDEVCQWAKGEFAVLVENAINVQYLGITENWISSKALGLFLKEERASAKYNSNTFGTRLKELGYTKVTREPVRAIDKLPTTLYYKGDDLWAVQQKTDTSVRDKFMKETGCAAS